MSKRFQEPLGRALAQLRWSPLKSMLLPAALLLAIDGSTAGVSASEPGDLLPDLPLASVNTPNRINGLTIIEQDDGSSILRLKGTQKPTFNVYRLSNPDRLVVDISGRPALIIPVSAPPTAAISTPGSLQHVGYS